MSQSKTFIVYFEVSDGEELTLAEFHNILCTAIHELDEDSLVTLTHNVLNIAVTGSSQVDDDVAF